MEKIETELTLDELDIIQALVEGYQANIKDDDEDKAEVDSMAERIEEFVDKIRSMSEYLTGNDFPENLRLYLYTTEKDIKASVEDQ